MKPGDNVAEFVAQALVRMAIEFQPSDIIVIAQKIISKSEGRYIRLGELSPSIRALELAEITGKSPELAEAILRESRAILRAKPGVIIAEHHSGHIMANAGIDHSNTDTDDPDTVLLLPENADASADLIRRELSARYGVDVGVIISDSLGRPWRLGTVGNALGASGLPALMDRRGEPDMDGRTLQITITGLADAVAAAAVLVMGEGNEARPAAIVRGLKWQPSDQSAKALLRPEVEDMFR